MSKVKGILLLLLGALLVKFALENWQLPAKPVSLFGYTVLPFPTALIIYGCLVLGFAAGWLAHAFRLRRKRRLAPASAEEEPEAHQAGHSQ
jgi:uncharacterized integral membrane protein